jgi:hypothetical protein
LIARKGRKTSRGGNSVEKVQLEEKEGRGQRTVGERS